MSEVDRIMSVRVALHRAISILTLPPDINLPSDDVADVPDAFVNMKPSSTATINHVYMTGLALTYTAYEAWRSHGLQHEVEFEAIESDPMLAKLRDYRHAIFHPLSHTDERLLPIQSDLEEAGKWAVELCKLISGSTFHRLVEARHNDPEWIARKKQHNDTHGPS